MAKLRVHNNAWVLIGDGRKCLILHNQGDAEILDLRRVSVREAPSEPTHEQGTERTGRVHESHGVSRSSVEATDWHQLDEQHFAREMAETLGKAATAHAFRELIVVAPPKVLAELRRDFSKEVRERIVAEIDKDLTGHPLDRIEKLLAAHEM